MPLPIIQLLAIAGFLLSVYFIYIEIKLKSKNQHKAICDINKTISCSKAAKSSYSNVLILPNALLGIFFYITIFTLSFFGLNLYTLILSFLASLFSLYLIYHSIKLKIACLVCISTHIINFLILYLSIANQ